MKHIIAIILIVTLLSACSFSNVSPKALASTELTGKSDFALNTKHLSEVLFVKEPVAPYLQLSDLPRVININDNYTENFVTDVKNLSIDAENLNKEFKNFLLEESNDPFWLAQYELFLLRVSITFDNIRSLSPPQYLYENHEYFIKAIDQFELAYNNVYLRVKTNSPEIGETTSQQLELGTDYIHQSNKMYGDYADQLRDSLN